MVTPIWHECGTKPQLWTRGQRATGSATSPTISLVLRRMKRQRRRPRKQNFAEVKIVQLEFPTPDASSRGYAFAGQKNDFSLLLLLLLLPPRLPPDAHSRSRRLQRQRGGRQTVERRSSEAFTAAAWRKRLLQLEICCRTVGVFLGSSGGWLLRYGGLFLFQRLWQTPVTEGRSCQFFSF